MVHRVWVAGFLEGDAEKNEEEDLVTADTNNNTLNIDLQSFAKNTGKIVQVKKNL